MFEVHSSGSENIIANKSKPCFSRVYWPVRRNQREDRLEPKGDIALGEEVRWMLCTVACAYSPSYLKGGGSLRPLNHLQKT